VNFKACFIGAGGFGADYKKCQELWPKVYNNISMHNLCPPSLTGDLIDAARKIGMGVDLKNASEYVAAMDTKHYWQSFYADNNNANFVVYLRSDTFFYKRETPCRLC
jgi:hypothetical protein